MASPMASEGHESSKPASPQVRCFYGSRPPSPSLFGRINLEKVNEKLRQRTATPETPTAERERRKARRLFDELVELGGVPLRPWVEYRPDDLPDGKRGDSDKEEEHLMRLYMRDQVYWGGQVKIWTRYAKRRKLDCEPDLRDAEPVAALAAFTVYLKGHLQRDSKDRARPGREVWGDYTCMMSHRDLMEDMVETLAEAVAVLRRLRSERGEENGLDILAVTVEELRKEYNIPRRQVWPDLWERNQASLPAPELESLRPLKRQRSDAEGENNEPEESPSELLESNSTPELENLHSPRHKKQKQQSPKPEQVQTAL